MGFAGRRLAVTVSGPNAWRLAELPRGDRPAGAVRLQLVSAGICGGDLELLAGHNAVARYPLTLGHECVARVVDADAGTGWSAGSHAVVYPTVSCGHCRACADALPHQCPTMRVMGLSHPDGCFSDELLVPAGQLIPVDPDIAGRYGALIEPLAVACHVTGRAGSLAGGRVLIIGAGVVGSLIAIVARMRGAAACYAIDRYQSRRATAGALGLDGVSTATGAELRSWLHDDVGPLDVVFDTVCTEQTVSAAVEELRPGATLVAVASAAPHQLLPLRYDRFFLKELRLVAARNYVPADFSAAIDMLREHRPDLGPLVTASYPLDRFADALACLSDEPERHLKVLLTPSSEATA